MLGGTGGRRRGRQRMMAGWHHWLGCESEWTPGVGDGQGGLACCDSWGRKESDTTERLNWTCISVPSSVHPHQHLLSLVFFDIILIGVKQYLNLIFTSVLLMIRDVEHDFLYLLAICMFPLKNCLFRSTIHCSIRFWVFFCFGFGFAIELYEFLTYLEY